ncbi:Hypothetical predicted protein [Marmota monax]|uniref:G-protein coupled receptors family 1 profile domain-containing protein n=1 Tax=Marmota monax TaxID=9995 RepID=A0A5E4C8Z1_MARMO|nr:hypothetical protein GHT09_000363 [Marmota monax]VTJ78407.1 Hypothetical predicted protein [Marmota monax]
MGNCELVLLVMGDRRLHTPMYYFLCPLALVDAGFTTSVVRPLLTNLHGSALRLPRGGCMAQLCVSLALGSSECVLLVVMALSRYAVLASPRLCRALAGASWLGGLANSATQTALLAASPLCPTLQLDPFIYELPALLKLACGGSGRDTIRVPRPRGYTAGATHRHLSLLWRGGLSHQKHAVQRRPEESCGHVWAPT